MIELLNTKSTSEWDAKSRILTTRLRGIVSTDDVKHWQAGLREALDQIETKTTFKLLADMTGYAPASLDAHKRMRAVIPLTQVKYGFRTRYVDLFEIEEITIHLLRGIRLTATAHVHHDTEKMQTYQKQLGTNAEGWFSDGQIARDWLLARP